MKRVSLNVSKIIFTKVFSVSAILLIIFSTSASDITIDFTKKGGPLKKAGVGSLFGVSAISGGFADKTRIDNSLIIVSASQGRIGENGSNPFSTDAIAPIIRGTGVKMVCRFGDLVYGWPYVWTTTADWLKQVDAATRTVSSSYKDVTLCIAPFNEPDHTLQGAFMTDPTLPAGTYDEKVVWLWTQTVKLIRSIDASIPIMGPNWESYRPWERNGADQIRTRAFLVNAINTNTVPDIMGFHSLGPSPGDVPLTLSNYYRPLEQELNLPGAPKKIIIEEYGPGTNDFEGVPGTVIKHLAEFARSGVDYGSMGIYANGGTLGNTMRYSYDYNSQPNAGWYMFNWYKQMTGEYVPVSRWDTRYYQAFDGVASWDNTSKTATVILGGSDDNADVKLLGIGALINAQVRVVLESTVWDVFSNEPGAVVENGGDPKTGTYNIFDKTFTCDGSGNLSIPIHTLSKYNAYRLVITAVASPATYATKYEAETAAISQSIAYTNNALTTSATGYVGGINNAGSYVQFNTVNAAADGIYVMTVRYASAAGVGATHIVSVNGEGQGAVAYDTTKGWSTDGLKTITKKLILKQGNNVIRLGKGNGYAELDYIDVRPETHRYEAEYALVNDANKSNYASEINYPDYVGGINNTDSYVEFTIDAPDTAMFALKIRYANGTTSNSTHAVLVNGKASGIATYVPTSGWLVNAPIANSNTACINVSLNGGLNKVRLTKVDGYAELDYVILALATPASINASGNTAFCAGGNVTLNANTGSGLTYQWNLNGAAISGANSNSYKATAAGTLSVAVTGNGCSTVSSGITVTVYPNPVATVTPASSLSFCQGANVLLNANTGTGLTYQWNNAAGTIVGATATAYTATTAGSYNVKVSNTNNCSLVSPAVAVVVNALPTAGISSSSTHFCAGSSLALNANTGTGLTYQWNNASGIITGATSVSYTASVAGTYSVKVINAANCSATSQAYAVTVDALPAASISSVSTHFCAGGNVALNANVGTGLTYQWSNAAGTISGATLITYSASAAGTYSVKVINAANCNAVSEPLTVTVDALPTASITSQSTHFCVGNNLTLNANAGTGLSYQWNNASGILTGATAATYTASASGIYSVKVMNATNCISVSQTLEITEDLFPSTANAGNDQYITTTSTDLDAVAPATGTGTWSLIFGTGSFSNTSLPIAQLTGINSDSTVLSWEVSNGACPPSVSKTIIYKGTAPVQQSIQGPATVLAGAEGITYSVPSVTGTTYVWTLPPGASITSSNADNSTITVSFGNTPGNVSVAASNKFGTSDSVLPVALTSITTGLNAGLISGYDIKPNPFTETISIKILTAKSATVRIVVSDLAGRIISDYTEPATGEYSVGDDLDTGMYVLSIYSGSDVNTFKIIKNK